MARDYEHAYENLTDEYAELQAEHVKAMLELSDARSVQKQLVEALEETIDHLRMFYQARWSEYEGTEQCLIGNARAALLAAKASS